MGRGVAGLMVLAGVAGCGPATEPVPEPTRFEAPIVGAPMTDVFYGAYLDEGGRDYSCGPKLYGGHRGTDILLRNFRVQDSGVTVVAAAAGTVAATHDGEFDRNTSREDRMWNFVSVLHPDGRTSYYGHLRAGSLKVAVGQRVTPGSPLGLVGSSGNSNWPHLHFEVRIRDSVLDPWEGSCHPASSLWRNQLDYQNRFQVLDTGILDKSVDGLQELLERPPDDAPITGRTGIVTVWAEFYNIHAALRVEYRGPDGSLIDSQNTPLVSTFSTIFVSVDLPAGPGLSEGGYSLVMLARPVGAAEFEEVVRHTFTLAPGAAAPSLRAGSLARPMIRTFSPAGDGPAHP
ncbi:MAG TPA: M23 family metallopeptidase [Gemmatimonadales bacterium]|nr:M23 family metallopeptidase [Gemmatimonadales bacterium]